MVQFPFQIFGKIHDFHHVGSSQHVNLDGIFIEIDAFEKTTAEAFRNSPLYLWDAQYSG